MTLRAAALLVTVGTAAACSGDSSGPEGPAGDGPVQFSGDPKLSQTAGVRASAGQQVVFGATTVKNSGDAKAVLDSATLVGSVDSTSARLVQVRALNPKDHNHTLVGAARWPFEDYEKASQPVAGYEVAGGEEVELLFVVEVLKTGQWEWPTTRVSYSQGDADYAASTHFGFAVCPSNAPTCP